MIHNAIWGRAVRAADIVCRHRPQPPPPARRMQPCLPWLSLPR